MKGVKVYDGSTKRKVQFSTLICLRVRYHSETVYSVGEAVGRRKSTFLPQGTSALGRVCSVNSAGWRERETDGQVLF